MLGIVHHIKFGEGEVTFLGFDGDDGDSGIIRAYDGQGEQKGEGKEVCECGRGSIGGGISDPRFRYGEGRIS